MNAPKIKRNNLDPKLLAQGATFDEATDEYVSKDGKRIAYEEWHDAPPDLPGEHVPLTTESLLPRNVREKMSVWFDQDVLDELRRRTSLPGGQKMARLINDALRAAYLSETIEDRRPALGSIDAKLAHPDLAEKESQKLAGRVEALEVEISNIKNLLKKQA